MKKLTLAALLIAAIAGNADAQKLNGLKDKVGGKKEESTSGTEKKKTVKPYAKDFTDAKNIFELNMSQRVYVNIKKSI